MKKQRTSLAQSPGIQEIIAARKKAGLTSAEAGRMVYACARSWQKWEAGDRTMHPAFWELFNIKTAEK